MAYNHDLLRKTELRIERISLHKANLNDIAATVAGVLGMERNEVLVTDLQRDVMTVDILRDTVDANRIVGKQEKLLERLGKLDGVTVTKSTAISSEGMLGWIAYDEKEAKGNLERSEKMAEEIQRKLSLRAIVFSTGFEVASGQIEDTNTPAIAGRMTTEGYTVTRGPTLKDDTELIAGTMRRAIYDEGYGLVITTGGVGAEAKDCTVEAVIEVDPDAATPYICNFEKGTGRHYKDGVRIAAGRVSDALIVALPGPNDEVRASLDILVEKLKSGAGKHVLAEELAKNLREILREKMKQREHGYHKNRLHTQAVSFRK